MRPACSGPRVRQLPAYYRIFDLLCVVVFLLQTNWVKQTYKTSATESITSVILDLNVKLTKKK